MVSAIVVGAGIFGLSVADHLLGSGWRVTLVEQYALGHRRQSSAGRTRFLRCAHGGDTWYPTLAWRAREMWQSLSRDCGESLFVENGVLWFARQTDGWESQSAATLRSLGIPCEELEARVAARMFPDFSGGDLAFVLHEPHAGLLRARRAVQVIAARVMDRGAIVIRGRAEPKGGAVAVDGRLLRADHVVWACGAWLPRVFPDLTDLHVTRQDVLYFGVPSGWSAPPLPGWIDFAASAYGCGDIDGAGMKVTSDLDGEPFDAETGQRQVLPRSVQLARAYLGRRFPALAGAPLSLIEVCQYTSTNDGEWIMAPHPEHPTVWLLGGDSGHGFKHGPALAEHFAGLLEGRRSPLPRFGLGPRPVARGLRTAGIPESESCGRSLEGTP